MWGRVVGIQYGQAQKILLGWGERRSGHTGAPGQGVQEPKKDVRYMWGRVVGIQYGQAQEE